MKKYEFLSGWNQGGSVVFTNDGTSILNDSNGFVLNFRQIEIQEIEYWLHTNFCKEV